MVSERVCLRRPDFFSFVFVFRERERREVSTLEIADLPKATIVSAKCSYSTSFGGVLADIVIRYGLRLVGIVAPHSVDYVN